ncbi:MAG: WYL domain-containing protein [Desulfovibrionales bacterium]
MEKRLARQQLEYIEFKLYWENAVTRKDLMEFFGVSRPQASILLKRYQEIAPENIRYDLSNKRYVRAREFSPLLISPSPEGYFNHLVQAKDGKDLGIVGFAQTGPGCDVVRPLQRRVEPGVLQKTIEAIRDGFSLRILYQSMTSDAPTMRIISPHAFVYDGSRWHVRAYCHSSRGFRDFVLIRIAVVAGREEEYVPPTDDHFWREKAEVKIGPHPELSPTQQEIIARDYGMKNGFRSIALRKALVFYFLQHLRLLDIDLRSPREQQIVLLNRDELAQCLPERARDTLEPSLNDK